jgi:hypothetical protein
VATALVEQVEKVVRQLAAMAALADQLAKHSVAAQTIIPKNT